MKNGILWPGELAAIYEIVWRAVELTTKQNQGGLHHKHYEDSRMFVSTRAYYDIDTELTSHNVEFRLNGGLVYKGDGVNHDGWDVGLLREGRDALRRLLVLDDLSEIL